MCSRGRVAGRHGVLGAVSKPRIFSPADQERPPGARAGDAFGAMLARFHYIAYGAGALLLGTLAAMAILGPRPRGFAARSALVTAMLLVALYSGVIVLGNIDAIQQEVGGLPSRLPAGDERRVRFDGLHMLSTRLMMVNIVGALALLYWEARSEEAHDHTITARDRSERERPVVKIWNPGAWRRMESHLAACSRWAHGHRTIPTECWIRSIAKSALTGPVTTRSAEVPERQRRPAQALSFRQPRTVGTFLGAVAVRRD